MLDLINDILDLSKVEAGHLELEKTIFNLVELVEKVSEMMAQKAHEKNLELLCRILPGTPVHLLGDPVRVRQILVNLLGNAVKFTGKTVPHAEKITQDQKEEDDPEIRPLKILLVEDAKENRIVVKAFLKKTPYTIQIAENGRIGVDKFVEGEYDLVLMDMRMPVMDGYTATGEIRKWEGKNKKPAIPIVALTAHALVEDRQKCLDAGCTDYLPKPIKKVDLLKKILECTQTGMST